MTDSLILHWEVFVRMGFGKSERKGFIGILILYELVEGIGYLRSLLEGFLRGVLAFWD